MITEKTFVEYVKIMSAKTKLFWHQLSIFVLFIYINIQKAVFIHMPQYTIYYLQLMWRKETGRILFYKKHGHKN